MKNKFFGILWPAILLLAPVVAGAQENNSIRGRVVTDGGKPLADVSIRLSSGNGDPSRSTSRSATTDAEGNFHFKNLPDRTYNLSPVIQKGYILASSQRLGGLRPGESITITMTRGGVITGRVTDPNGEPVIGISVSAMRVRDQEGRKVNSSFAGIPRTTDDRGIYRLYGLPPGAYVVVANGAQSFVAPGISPYHGETPTYHPSSTRADAAEIKVSNGDEATGVDIRYRGETGRVVSGKVTGGEQSLLNTGAGVSLREVTTGVIVANAAVRKNLGESNFVLQGVPDGEYELEARYGAYDSDESFQSEPRRITVKGTDVGNLELLLISLAIVYGRVALEKAAACDPKRKLAFEEMSVVAQRDERADGKPQPPWRMYYSGGSPAKSGEFKITRLTPGRYRLNAGLQNETGFIKSISGPVISLSSRGVPVRSGVMAELSRSGLALKPAERYSDVTIAVSDGGASLQGKVVPKEGAKLPARAVIHLIPAEATAADDLLRYAERGLNNKGEFTFNNLAPGKYRLLMRALPENDEPEGPKPPAHWDAAERARLRKDAETANHEIELKPCQRVKDHLLQK